MGDDQIDVGRPQPVLLERGEACRGEVAHRVGKDDLAGHVDEVFAFGQRLRAGRVQRPAAGNAQRLGLRPIGVQVDRQHAAPDLLLRVVGQPQHGSTGAIAEQDAGVAILPVDEARQHFDPAEQDAPVLTAAQKAFRHGEAIQKAAAGRRQIERRTARRRAHLALHEHRARGQRHIGADRRADYAVDLPGGDPGRGARALPRGRRQIRGRLTGSDDPPGADAGALADPGIRGINLFTQIFVGQLALGNGAAGA